MSRCWPGALLGILLLGGGLLSSGPIEEKDVFWHIASGRFILEERRLPEPDPFTFTAGDRRDVHHEWLAQVILAAVERAAGLGGLRVLRGVLEVATMALGLLAFRRRTGRFGVILAALCLWWVLYQPNTTIRPHLFGWLLAVLVLGLRWDSPPRGGWRRRILTFALLVLWANLHSSVVIVPVVLGLYWLGMAAGSVLGRRRDPGRLLRAAEPWGLSIVACLAQPAGPGLYKYLLITPAANRELSTEWLPLFRPDVWAAHAPLLVAFVLVALWVVFALVASGRDRTSEFPGPLVALAALVLACQMRRMTFFLFLPLLYAVPVTSRWLDAHLQTRLRPALAFGAGLLLVTAAVAINRRPDVPLLDRQNIVPGEFPAQAAEFLADARLQGRMFNPVNWGGYLSYRLYPGYRTFGDGRWTLFGREVVLDSQRVLGRRGNVESIFDRYGIDLLVQPVGLYFRTAPLEPTRWVLAYQDDVTAVLLRRTAALAENLVRVCDFYDRHPALGSRGRWQLILRGEPGEVTPTSIPAAIDECAAGGERARRVR